MTGITHDLRRAIRLFAHDWRYSTTLVVTLATGIAATAIVFNVLNNTLLRPLPIPNEQRVFRLQDWTMGPDGQPIRRSNRIPNFLAIARSRQSFDAVIGMRSVERPLIGAAEPVQVTIAQVSPGTFDLLGVRPVMGRLFTPDEEQRGVDAGVIILSHSLWQQQFGGRADVVGMTLRLDEGVFTVIGVFPRGFRFPYLSEAWIPERVPEGSEASVAVFARLAPHASREQAQDELERLAVALERERPATNRGVRFYMAPMREALIGDQARATWSLLAASILLLGLACANVANLLLARGSRRTREHALHAALGAGRGRQIRQLLIESLVHASVGTAAGLLVAGSAGQLVMNLVPATLRDQLGLDQVAFDWRVAVFAATVTTITAVVAGLAPARRLASTDAIDLLRQQSRGSTGPRSLMHALVVGEVALAAMLLLASGLLLDHLNRLRQADLGLRAEGLAATEIALPPSRYEASEARLAIARGLLEAARAVPGVEAAGLASINPLDRGSFGAAIESEDRLLGPAEPGLIVNHRLVSPGWIEAAGVAVIRGRAISDRDIAESPRVAVVSARLAARLWPGAESVGKRIRQTRPGSPWITVVGVAADVRDFGDWRETWYVPYAQHAASLAGGTLHLMVRSPVDPAALGRDLRRSIATVDPLLPVPPLMPMTGTWDAALEQQQLAASASGIFAAAGLLLAIIGTYGVLSYAVSARARELGIRVALGARRGTLLGEVVRHGLSLTAAGLALGTIAGLGINRLLQGFATESPGTPLPVVLVVIAVVGASALTSSLIPAWRATTIDPAEVMRSE